MFEATGHIRYAKEGDEKVRYGLLILLWMVTLMSSAVEKATFAGGCFWCMQPSYDELLGHGVTRVTVGYTGGKTANPTYEQVSRGDTGHIEAIDIEYDPKKIRYETLLAIFWSNIDPVDTGGQFADRGSQYKTAIFYHDALQKKKAEDSKGAQTKKWGKPVAVKLLKAEKFYPAEAHHQGYYKNCPLQYDAYKKGSGREDYLEKQKKIEKLSSLQFEVTQQCGTEKPFENEHWDNHEEGLYVDIVSGEPLFSSKDKFDSGTGWPSFTKPIDATGVVEIKDTAHGMQRTEVKSKKGNSHLGHVFSDGPAPTGQRYCINSASLRFIPIKDLDSSGYGQYKDWF